METHLSGAATIDLAAIQKQLKAARSKEGAATATTMNFVVYIDDRSLHDRALERAEHFAQKYPARVVILDATRAKSADVASSARHVGEGATVNAERVELGIAGLSPQEVSSSINSLRVGDIPDVLWWTSRSLAKHALFEEMLPLMDVLIVDSSGLDLAETAICELTAFAQRGHPILLRDLAYMRLSPWQDMVAQFFDDPNFASELARIERIEVSSGSAAETCYLVGWLASRLQWTPCSRFELCDSAGRHIRLLEERRGQMRRVLRVALSTHEQTFAAELTDSPDTVCLTVTGTKTAAKRCTPLHHIDNMSLLEKAFLFRSRDEVFEASLRVLCDLFKFDR